METSCTEGASATSGHHDVLPRCPKHHAMLQMLQFTRSCFLSVLHIIEDLREEVVDPTFAGEDIL
eukprot:5025111-Amphidinium_carterae.2